MNLTLSPQQETFRKEVRDFIEAEATPQTEEAMRLGAEDLIGHKRAWFRKLGARGWLVPTLPPEYGGLGASYTDRFIIYDEISYHRVPSSTANLSTEACMVAPSLMMFGSEEQKRSYVPRIARGEISFGLGYTESGAGSDLGALASRAIEDGDHFVINGSKYFCTHIHCSDYLWLAARTDPTLPKNKGISLFIVDPKTPGITIRPFWTMGGDRTNEVFFDDVRVPSQNLVGEKNRGFHQIAVSLVHYRNFYFGFLRRELEELVEYAKQAKCDGQPLARNQIVRHKLADLAMGIEVGNLLAMRAVWMWDNGMFPEWEGMMAKVFGTEFQQRFANTGIQIIGLRAMLQDGPWAALKGRLETMLFESVRDNFVRGSAEIIRNTLALRALRLPRG